MLFRSILETRGFVDFPEFTGERIYMEPFRQKEGLPPHLGRWQPTVDAMLEGIVSDLPIYLMIDQSAVMKNTPQRRPGVHIDGYWIGGDIQAHGGSGSHTPIRRPSHTYNKHLPRPTHMATGWGGGWSTADFKDPEAIILASSVSAARALVGEYEGPIGDMGDCTHLKIDHLTSVPMMQNRVYAGNVTCLHESLPVQEDCLRTLVRLNVPGWTPAE